MDNIKQCYIDTRHTSNDSTSNSDFKFELEEALDLPDDTVFYIDDISIPHSWYSIEYFNNKMYINTYNGYGNTILTILLFELYFIVSILYSVLFL